jgi:hypothetical protein
VVGGATWTDSPLRGRPVTSRAAARDCRR